MPQLVVRIPEDIAAWLENKCPARGDASKYVRQLLTAEQMREATAPLVPEDEVRGVWKGTAAEWAAFQEGAGFETPEEPETIDLMVALKESIEAKKAEPKPKARRKDVRKVPDQPVSVKNRGGHVWTTQEPSSKTVKGSPSDRSVQAADGIGAPSASRIKLALVK